MNKIQITSIISTFAARVSLSPDSPTQMFKQSLRMRTSRITFLDESFGSFRTFLATTFFTSCKKVCQFNENCSF